METTAGKQFARGERVRTCRTSVDNKRGYDDCWSKTRCAFSMRNSMQSALPAMSLNSALGSGERMSVAARGRK